VQPLIRTEEKPPWPARLLGLAELAGWALAGLVAARLIWLALTPAGPLGSPQVALPLGPVLVAVDPFFPSGPAAADAVSSLDLVLLGTRVDAASGRGSAILATPDGQQKSVGVGEEIMPGVRLAAVEFESVTLDRGGAREQLYIDQSGSAGDAVSPRQDKK
jgi:general secretion pathway protein C